MSTKMKVPLDGKALKAYKSLIEWTKRPDSEAFWKRVLTQVAPKVDANERVRVASLQYANSRVMD